jgi:ribosomal protein S18 acetylase RimI-like enzyme
MDHAELPTGRIEIIDVTDAATYGRIPPCADPGFDHRSCDYWEDADRGSKAIRLDWLGGASSPASARAATGTASDTAGANPFLADLRTSQRPAVNPFLDATDDDGSLDNPFAPKPIARAAIEDDAPRKLRLLGRGLSVAGSYAKVLILDDAPAVYAQFGPLTAYPRAQRTRDLYPALPDAPLPAVITCIATTAAARGNGLARHLIEMICDDLATRGCAAVETYPEVGARPDSTSGATPWFWQTVGFEVAAPDDRFPVLRRELD